MLQLSSKSDGIVDSLQTAANGSHTFHYADIQAQFDQLSALARSAGMVPIVLTANDFGTKRTENGEQLWVLLADPGRLSFPGCGPEPVLKPRPTYPSCRQAARSPSRLPVCSSELR